MKLAEEIAEIVARERMSNSEAPVRQRVSDALSALLEVEADDWGAFHWLEYQITIGNHDNARKEADILRWLRPLEISAAPEAVALIALNESLSLLARCYWACPREKLIPADDWRDPFLPAARDRYRRDMKKLADHGKIQALLEV
jgi:hypothetical protein